MKKAVLMIVMASLTLTVNAQPGGGGMMRGGGMPMMGMPMMENQLSGLPDFEAEADKQSQEMKEKLGLDDKQTKKVRSYLKSEGEDRANIQISYNRTSSMMAMFSENTEMSEDDIAMQKEMDKMEAKYDAKFKKLFSPEQYEGWKEYEVARKEEEAKRLQGIRDNMAEEMKNMMQGGGFPGGGFPGGGFPGGGGFGGGRGGF